MGLLKDKVALVTGAGSGIGKATALRLASEGALVVVSDLNEAAGKETIDTILRANGTALFFKADVASPPDNQALVQFTLENFGKLHIAVNNAGIAGLSKPTGEYPIAEWDKVIAINLSGVFYGMRYQLPALMQSGGGSIVNIASILGKVAFANSVAYVAAKHGVIGLTENAAVEYAARGIRVNSVGPGFIKTPLIENSMTPEARSALIALHPMKRLGESAEVAEMVLWLSSEQASFVTGAYFPVDGGYLAR